MVFLRRILCVVLVLTLAGIAFGQGIVKEIIVTGNKQISKEAITASMRTAVGQQVNQAALEQDKRSIEDMGFFQAVDIQPVLAGDDSWEIHVRVSEFSVIKEIRVVGNTIMTKQDIENAITLKKGQVFNLKQIAPSTRAISELYGKKGYLANIDDFGMLEDAPEVLNISVIEYTVGTIKVVGLTRTKESVIRKLLRTQPGDPYNLPRLQRDMARAFYNTNWFEEVHPEVSLSSEEIGKVDITVTVKEGRTGNLNFGIQLDPRSSFAGVLRVSDSNFKGTGQSIGINYLQATTGTGASIDIDYVNPFIDNRQTTLSASAYSRVLYRFAGIGFGSNSSPTDDNRYTERRTGGSFALTRPIKETLFGSVQVRAENIKTEDLNTNSTNNFIQQDGDLVILAGGLLSNNRDVDQDPSRGSWWRLLVEPGYSRITRVGGQASSSMLGTNTFLRSSLEYRHYWSPQPPRELNLDEPRRVVAVRARIGSISGNVPFFEQFFVGGADTVRGYPEDRFWGKQYATFTVEYRHPLQKAFNLIAFADYGGAWGGYGGVNKYTQSDRPNFHLGYGLGVSFRTPLGPIRLDFGFNENGGSRTHFLIGTSF
jgi:outer membrane protein insertion porin family